MNREASSREGLRNAYIKYLELAGEATFVDIARSIDPACVDQPWESFRMLIEEFGAPKVIQIWTKGPRGVLEKGRGLLDACRKAGSLIICQLTVNAYGPLIEPRVPWPVDWAGIDEMIDFLGTPKAVLWRYDPVIPGISDLGVLESLAQSFSSRGVFRATYNWGECGWELVRSRMGHLYGRIDAGIDMNEFSREIERIGRKYGIYFMILAEAEGLACDLNLTSRGIWQYEWLVEVGNAFPPRDFMPGAKRNGCICAPSFDIGLEGQFGECHGCVYCFAP